jgi:hypothetical protein
MFLKTYWRILTLSILHHKRYDPSSNQAEGSKKMQNLEPMIERARPAQPAPIDSATLARLIEEVRNEPTGVERSYDRAHNRHNR